MQVSTSSTMADNKEGLVPGQPLPPRKGNGTSLLTINDPQGYSITLHVETWDRHVLVGHPEMRDRLDLVKAALESPELIQRAATGENTVFYYKVTGEVLLRHKDLYVAVVVERIEDGKTGFVKTAFLLKKLRRDGGEILWFKRV